MKKVGIVAGCFLFPRIFPLIFAVQFIAPSLWSEIGKKKVNKSPNVPTHIEKTFLIKYFLSEVCIAVAKVGQFSF